MFGPEGDAQTPRKLDVHLGRLKLALEASLSLSDLLRLTVWRRASGRAFGKGNQADGEFW